MKFERFLNQRLLFHLFCMNLGKILPGTLVDHGLSLLSQQNNQVRVFLKGTQA
jgi:hypothetical protein